MLKLLLRKHLKITFRSSLHSVFSNLAIDGYDTVAYFKIGKATVGREEFTYEYNNVEWRFSTLENLEAFKKSPEKYMPQYGAHCSWRMATGVFYHGSPRNWNIYKGKLYFNYDTLQQNLWVNNKDYFIKKANKNWVKKLLK